MAFGNDARIRVGRKHAVKAELYSCLLDRFYEGVLSRAWYEDVVGRHANLRSENLAKAGHIWYVFSMGGRGFWLLYLTGVQGLSPEDTLCGDLEVRRVGVNDHGRLPA